MGYVHERWSKKLFNVGFRNIKACAFCFYKFITKNLIVEREDDQEKKKTE